VETVAKLMSDRWVKEYHDGSFIRLSDTKLDPPTRRGSLLSNGYQVIHL
jgi:hypothetical protein